MPTGVAIRDAHRLLFAAAERILSQEGPNALSSRSVTAEAGVAKGVLHRHFADFDAFLAELIIDRVGRLRTQAIALREAAGTATVADNLTGALIGLFDPVAMGAVGLITTRDGLRHRLRDAGLSGIPPLTEATSMTADYLAAERDHGRITPDADLDTLATSLIGTAHLLFANGESTDSQAMHKIVATIIMGAVTGS